MNVMYPSPGSSTSDGLTHGDTEMYVEAERYTHTHVGTHTHTHTHTHVGTHTHTRTLVHGSQKCIIFMVLRTLSFTRFIVRGNIVEREAFGFQSQLF